VPVPGEGTPLAFWLIVGLMAAMLVGLVVLFRRRGWL
jgi:LPXTG-motif cell wall-anchored protein